MASDWPKGETVWARTTASTCRFAVDARMKNDIQTASIRQNYSTAVYTRAAGGKYAAEPQKRRLGVLVLVFCGSAGSIFD